MKRFILQRNKRLKPLPPSDPNYLSTPRVSEEGRQKIKRSQEAGSNIRCAYLDRNGLHIEKAKRPYQNNK